MPERLRANERGEQQGSDHDGSQIHLFPSPDHQNAMAEVEAKLLG